MDLNSKTAEKLFGTVAEGVGALANHWFELDAKKIKRIGEAEAEAEKQKIIKQAEATESAQEILARADKRFLLEQYSKQINLENIIVMARDAIGDSEVSDESVDPDWSRRFVSVAQDVSREDMQKILANILVGEVKQPDTFSLRTLDFVNNLSTTELNLFNKIIPFTSSDGYVHITKSDANNGFAHISYENLLELMEIGFIKPSLNTVRNVSTAQAGKSILINMRIGTLMFKFIEDRGKEGFPVIQLSRTAAELAQVMDLPPLPSDVHELYVAELEEFYSTKQMERLRP